MKARLCLGCGSPTTARSGRCGTCQTDRDRARNAAALVYRDPRWEPLRRLIIGRHRARWGGICLGLPGDPPSSRHLTGPDNPLSVDHIVPVALGGAPFDPANLQVLCRRCNSRKDAGLGGLGRRAISGLAGLRRRSVG